jgi:cytochrome c-type biogenesis protein CcmH
LFKVIKPSFSIQTHERIDMKFRPLFLMLLISLVSAVWVSSIVYAQQPKPTPSDDEVNAVARGLYCPVCENIPLDVCPTQACAQWRDLIRQKLGQGWTSQQVKDYFVQQYGDRVLATPPAHGLNWLVYVLPPIFFLGAVYILYRTLRGARLKPGVEHKTGSEKEPEPPVDPNYLARLEEELKRRE